MGSTSNRDTNDKDKAKPAGGVPPTSPPPPTSTPNHNIATTNRGLRRSQQDWEAKKKGQRPSSSSSSEEATASTNMTSSSMVATRPTNISGSKRMISSTSTASSSSGTGIISEKGLRNNASATTTSCPQQLGALRVVDGRSTSITTTASKRGLRQNNGSKNAMKTTEHLLEATASTNTSSSMVATRPANITGSKRMTSSTSTASSSSGTGISEKGLRNNASATSVSSPQQPGVLRVEGRSTSTSTTTSSRGLRQNGSKNAMKTTEQRQGVATTASSAALVSGSGGKSGRGLSSKKNLSDALLGGKKEQHRGLIHQEARPEGDDEENVFSTVQQMPPHEADHDEPQVQPGAHPVNPGGTTRTTGDQQEEEDVNLQEEEIHMPATGSFDLETGNAASGDLVEARAVEGAGSSTFMAGLQEAQEVSKQHLEAKEFKKYKRQECRRTGYVIILISLLILFIGLGVGLKKSNNNTSSKTVVVLPTEPTKTTVPLPSETMAPTEDPLQILLESLPTSTVENIQRWGTPQQQAFDWLRHHKNVTHLAEWRKTQLFALATFYYSFEGPNWLRRLNIQLDWLDEDKNECDWFSGEYGTLCDEQGYKEGARHDVDSCNEKGEFLALSKVCMQMEGLSPTMPPEIALLTSLSIIELAENNIEGNVMDMLPAELFHMESLTKLYIEGNALTGTVPTEVGLFPSLWKLDIFNNQLTGTIPTQVGRLTTLVRLQLANNSLTGTIPTELGIPNLTGPPEFGVGAHTIDLSGNSLTGPIPSELGQLTTTEWLHLQNNALTGPIPSELGSMSWLRELYLDGNAFSGSLPSQLGLISLMETLDLADLPHLTGSIPSELSQLSNVRSVNLQGTSGLSGTIPQEFCYLQQQQQEPDHGNNTTTSCVYDSLSSWHNGTWRTSDCSLLFDCSPTSSLLCGCNCDCANLP